MLKPVAVVELVWRDASGSTAVTMLSVNSSSTVEEIDVDATALASLLLPLTDAVLIGQRIKYRSQTVPRTEPVNSTPITRSGAFFFSTSPSTPDGAIIIPSIKDEVISEVEPFAGVGIDRDNPSVVTFVSAVLDSGFATIFGDEFTELVAAYVQSRV